MSRPRRRHSQRPQAPRDPRRSSPGSPALGLGRPRRGRACPSREEEAIEAFDTFRRERPRQGALLRRAAPAPSSSPTTPGSASTPSTARPASAPSASPPRPDLSGTALDRGQQRPPPRSVSRGSRPSGAAPTTPAPSLSPIPPAGESAVRGPLRRPHPRPTARGTGGFGYDPLFFLPGEDATFGELPADVKNRISHRARALRNALPLLRARLAPPRRPPARPR